MPEPDPDDALIRRLLGEARVDEPVPAEVLARLDHALAELGGEGPSSNVARLRRRRVLGGLVAAAVVLVGGGIAVSQLSDHDSNLGAASGSAAGSAASGDSGSMESKTSKQRSPAAQQLLALTPGLAGRAALPALHTARFGSEVRRLVEATAAGSLKAAPDSGSLDQAYGDLPRAATADCVAPVAVPRQQLARDDVRTVSLDGAAATLVVRPAGSDPRTATAYSCDGRRELASTTLED